MPLFVAELSANHLGSIERALELIDVAAKVGANAVKLQTYDPMRMAGNPDLVIESGPWAGRKMVDLYREAVTPMAWHKRLFHRIRGHGMLAFSSAFSPEDVDALEELGCPMYKIASFELVDLPLIRYAAQTKKPMVISTGMGTMAEIEEAVATALDSGCQDLTVLKCSSAYPAPIEGVNLNTIRDMQDYFAGYTADYFLAKPIKIGFSDHTHGAGAAVAAVVLGATMIEKHLTLSRADGGPDGGFSAEPADFAAMVQAARQAEQALGRVSYGPTEAEKPSLALRRSLWWSEPGKAGTVVRTHCLRTARPATGLAPREMHRVIGKRLMRDVAPGEPVQEADFS